MPQDRICRLEWFLRLSLRWSLGLSLRFFLGGAIALLLSPGAIAQPPVGAIVQLKDLKLPEPEVSGRTIVPLSLLQASRGVYTLELSVGDRDPAAISGRFLFDTGASTTLLSAPLRKRLDLVGKPVPTHSLAYAVAGKSCPALTATRLALPPLNIQDVKIRQLQVLQFDQTLIPEGADGVLGMDVLRQFQFTVDPQQRRLSLRPPQPLSPAQRLRAIPLEMRSGVMLAQLWLNGQGPFTMLVDTGADGTFIARGVAKTLALGDRTPIQMLGFCGLEDAEQTQLAQVSFTPPRSQVGPKSPPQRESQRESPKALDAVITDSSILQTLGIDGVLGQNFLNQYQQHWHLSPQENWLLLEPPQNTSIKSKFLY